MANTNTTPSAAPPDWWQREKQRRMNRVLIFLILLIALIALYYRMSSLGNVGQVGGLTFDTADHIAFVRTDDKGNTTLYAVRTDGTDLRPLTPAEDVSKKEHPVWTRDGKSLLYASNLRDNKITQIYILGSDTPKQLTYGTGNKSAPAVSNDGKTAAFIVQGAVKIVNLNGTEVSQLMPLPSGSKSGGEETGPTSMDPEGPFLSAEFSPDGIGICGTQNVSGQLHATLPGVPSIDEMVMAVPPGSSKMVALDKGHETSFSWEPNGSRLACSYTELEATDAKGKTQVISGIRLWSFKNPNKPEPVNLFAGLGFSVEPRHIAWSPDGSKMAFETWRLKAEGVREMRGIVVMDTTLDSSRPQGIVVTPAVVDSMRYMVPAGPEGLPQNPRWAPDGGRLLYELQRPDGKHDLWVINSDGTNKINLTKGQGDNTDGVWSPVSHKP